MAMRGMLWFVPSMADDPLASQQRSMTRLKAEAPPGLSLSSVERKMIGRYEIVKTLGKGAMGVVYKAIDPLLDRTVAVKTIMSPQSSGRRVRSAFLERFQREAKAAAKMQHPAIVTIFDVGIDEESGAPFMVLEYLPGESLADRLDRVRISLGKAVSISLDLASALSFAHNQRIVHRDVKPANVLHAGENRWKLADFGIARMPDSDLTQVGIFMGTPGYSPPESIREGRYTPQADVFAWGAVLYELMSGRIPYEGPDTKTTNSYVVQGNALPPTRHDSSIPEPLSAVCMRALQSSAEHRFRDGAEAEASLREAWDRCLMQGLIHPAVLAMDEMPHDKVPAQMHVPRGAVGPMPAMPAVAQMGGGAGSGLRALPQAPMVGPGSGARPMPPPAAVPSATFDAAMSALDRLDDDPTTIMSRDELANAQLPPKGGVAAGRRPGQPPAFRGPQGGQGQPVLAQGYQGPLAHDATIPSQALALGSGQPGFSPSGPLGPSGAPSGPGASGAPQQARGPQGQAMQRQGQGQAARRSRQPKPGSMWMIAALSAGALLVVLVLLLALGVI
jgi:eukaryotic-like serine/threonine-protein kinase